MPIYPYKGITPRVAPDVFIAPTACIIGDVTIGAGSSIWFNAVLRGDMAPIVIGAGCNVQDNCTIHTDTDMPAIIGDNCSMGHGAIVHAATLEDGVLVAIGAIVLSRAHIGAGSLIAAAALVAEGKHIPPRSLVMGVPGKVAREVTAAERQRIAATAAHYLEEAKNYLK